jgi:hypothetical protein
MRLRFGRNWPRILFIVRLLLAVLKLCLVVGVPAYRSRGPGSIPDATRFSEK